jgi:hypothetical protein
MLRDARRSTKALALVNRIVRDLQVKMQQIHKVAAHLVSLISDVDLTEAAAKAEEVVAVVVAITETTLIVAQMTTIHAQYIAEA